MTPQALNTIYRLRYTLDDAIDHLKGLLEYRDLVIEMNRLALELDTVITQERRIMP